MNHHVWSQIKPLHGKHNQFSQSLRRPTVEEGLVVVAAEPAAAAADGQSDRRGDAAAAWGREEDAHVLPRRARHQRAVALRNPQG